MFGEPSEVAAITSPSVNVDETLCFHFWFDLSHHDGIDDVTIYVESNKDLTRIPIWEYHHTLFENWERGQVEIPKFEDYKASMNTETESNRENSSYILTKSEIPENHPTSN